MISPCAVYVAMVTMTLLMFALMPCSEQDTRGATRLVVHVFQPLLTLTAPVHSVCSLSSNALSHTLLRFML